MVMPAAAMTAMIAARETRVFMGLSFLVRSQSGPEEVRDCFPDCKTHADDVEVPSQTGLGDAVFDPKTPAADACSQLWPNSVLCGKIPGLQWSAE